MAERPGREYGNGQGDPLGVGFTKKTPSLGPSLGLRPALWKLSPTLAMPGGDNNNHSDPLQLPGTVASTLSVLYKGPHNEHKKELACTSSMNGETETKMQV